jgi:competence protein ComEA
MIRTLHRSAIAVALCAFLVSSIAVLSSAPSAEAAPKARVAKVDKEAPKRKRAKKAPPKAREVEGKINLNKADAEQLQVLPGVGKIKAARIVAWRDKHGSFKRIKDLRRVKGFGKKTVDKLEVHLALAGPTTLRLKK